MNKFAIALASFVSLGLAIPAFAQEKKDTIPADKMQGENVGKHNKMGKHDKMVVHHHHHMMIKPESKNSERWTGLNSAGRAFLTGYVAEEDLKFD